MKQLAHAESALWFCNAPITQTEDPTTAEFLGLALITEANSLCERIQNTNGAASPSQSCKTLLCFKEPDRFWQDFQRKQFEILSMNSNINILGVHYVNPCFSGALDKINGSKEQALKAAGEILCVCCAPWRLGAELGAHWGPALPSCSGSCCCGTIKFCPHMAGLCLKNLFSPCLGGREVPPWQNWAVHLLYIPLALHGTEGWPGLHKPICVLEQIFGDGPVWPWQTHWNSWGWWTMTYQDRETWEQISPGTCALYTNTWPGPCSPREELCPGETPFFVV